MSILFPGSNERITKVEQVTGQQIIENLQILTVDSIILHDQFDFDGNFDNDIALLRLTRSAELSSSVGTVCLPEIEDSEYKDHLNFLNILIGLLYLIGLTQSLIMVYPAVVISFYYRCVIILTRTCWDSQGYNYTIRHNLFKKLYKHLK